MKQFQPLAIKFILITLAGLTIIPFLLPYAYFPINKFYSELYSLCSGLFIFIVFFSFNAPYKFSPATLSCFAFALFAIIQPMVIHTTLISINFYLFILFTALGMYSIAITSLANSDTDQVNLRQKLLNTLCFGFVISGIIQSFIGYIQFCGHEADFNGWILASSYNDGTGSNVFGNVGQRNQYINLLSTAAMSAIYLFSQKRIKIMTFIACISVFNIAMTFCAGRTVFVYFLFALLVCGLMLLKHRNTSRFQAYKQLSLLILLYLGLLIAIEIALPLIIGLFNTTSDIPTGITRLSSEYVGQSTYRRFYEWYKAILIFSHHPLFGIGWFQYPKEAIYMMLDKTFYYIPANKRLYTHCHNSIFNIMAETGAIGALITIGYGVVYSLHKLLKHCNDGLAILALSSPILMHSCFEYPLWYTYFIVIFVTLLSFAPPVFTIAKIRNIYKILIATLIAVFIFIALQSFSTANTLVTIANPPEESSAKIANIQLLENIIDQEYNIFNYSALMALDGYLPQNIYDLTTTLNDIKYISLLGNIAPYPGEIFKQMLLYHVVGDDVHAEYYANLLAHAYPALQQDFITQLSSCTNCGNLVSKITDFAYEDRSPFAKWFDAMHHKQSY